MWPERFSINVLEKEPNFYTVEFRCFGDRRHVLIGQPWHIDYKLIVMTPLEAGSVVTTDTLTSTPFWVQVSGIPFLKRSRALAQWLGEVLGHFIEVDTASLKETWGPYLRVRIEIDVTQPLPRDFCHYCGRLSHIVNHCHEFLAKCDSSSAPPLLHYDQSLGAKIRITSNPFYIACSRTRQRPHIANPTSLAPTPPYRLHQPPVISKGLFNEPTSSYGVQHLSQPQNTPLGFYMAHSSSNVIAHTKGASNVLSQSNTIPSIPLPFPPITTTEQLATPLPMDVSTSADTIVATNGASQHVVPVSQAFSTILAYLNPLWMSAPGFEDCLLDAWTLNNHNHHSNPLIGFNEKLYNCSSRLKQWKQSLGPPLATKVREVQSQLKFV
ncbi:hypothetical protein F8388_001257 [Cannabis sativa]|uniref:DUF4283 domain-containing protein n=1 Tax=Cannabis sativa TaxID=3483 RepID=A0A7J6GGY4_CANSA|nr:hypothetical protein F8388_001257 [Cannabis sativa]